MIETDSVSDLASYCLDLGQRARVASRALATISGDVKNRWLLSAAEALQAKTDIILKANQQDLARTSEYGLNAAQIDRLKLTPQRLKAAVQGLCQVAAMPDPVGRVLEGSLRPNGLEIRKVGVPIGVLLFLYESRPNVTVDAGGLAVKSGNAVILRGGKEAIHSNAAIVEVLQSELKDCRLPVDSVQLVTSTDRDVVGELLKLSDYVDVVIPRGGESLIRRVAKEATMPVLKHFRGNCHVYVHRAADLAMAERIIINAKCQRPGVCNAMESLLVDAEIAPTFLPRIGKALRGQNVEIRGCAQTRQFIPWATPAAPEDYDAEFLELILSAKVVNTLEEAIAHINRHGSQHTDAIVTNDIVAAQRFCEGVDSAAVMVNASTRFHDGFEFGLGAEIGISTDKLHARGPCGLQELTTYKYVVFGKGHIRE